MAARTTARHLLAQNEHPYPPLPSILAALAGAADDLHRYPAFRPVRIEQIIADWQGVPAEHVVVGHGSAGVALDLFHTLVEPGDNVVHSAPCFDAYPMFCDIVRAEARAVPLGGDARHDLAAMAAQLDERTRVIVLCNPHNPTGTVYSWAELTAFFRRVPPTAVILLDEAYVDFARGWDAPSVPDRIAEFPNLVVLRTLSKSHGIAALRIGYALAAPELARRVKDHQVPYAVNRLQEAALLAAVSAQAEVEQRIAEITAERDRLSAELVGLGWSVAPSLTNFLWVVAPGDHAPLRAALEEREVAVRYYPGQGIRIAIGEKDANDAVLEGFASLAR
ncbi:Putative histidinol-phosphate aminotransferase [Kitasatospora sp. MMS16-BH015]|uniref:pyridoxal phosphate-dependent aminotransferase n=1 Tax=Kitasatospora sp. MMS16-BH015 TaxID=2018025 RepID=UPI000CA1DE69|nr:aminotransferase class I/II-fold pyridoxal phosphate-dependent enzyme [Kitasatospora sp. MMS16-BH015]AUG80134.1 Putative histidinol-phosphate aminotransferase [Kitasatospora sp. MMS16-BH015]